MNLETQIFTIVFFLFMWTLSAWESLTQLSGGRVRKIEEKNKMLAAKLESWIEERRKYDVVFKAIILLMITVMTAVAALIFPDDYQGVPPLAGAGIVALKVFIVVIAAETVARFFLYKIDIIILRCTLPVIRLLGNTILFPAVFMLEKIEDRIDRWQREEKNDELISAEDEIMSLVDSPESVNDVESIEEEEKKMIKGVFSLDDVLVREIMTPRVDIVAIDEEASVEDAMFLFTQSGYSRIPLFKNTVDEIKGILYAKDFLDDKKTKGKKLSEIAHKPVFIPETKALDVLLSEFKKTGKHFAVVIDEFGGTSGILTLEDIIENIVGEIKDEYDTEEDVSPKPVFLADGSMNLEGRTPITMINELFNTEIPDDEDFSTIGGFISTSIGRIPSVSEEFTLCKNVHFKILKADKRKIITLNISVLKNQKTQE